jgi:hypothetical protein
VRHHGRKPAEMNKSVDREALVIHPTRLLNTAGNLPSARSCVVGVEDLRARPAHQRCSSDTHAVHDHAAGIWRTITSM